MENESVERGEPGNEIALNVPDVPAVVPASRTIRERAREKLRSLSFKSVLGGLTSAATIIPSIGIVVALVWQIGLEGFDQSLEVEPISVPKSIEEDGYTPTVVAQRLEDAMRRIMVDASTNMKRHRIASYSEPSTTVNSGSSTSLGVVISSVLHFLHLSARTYVSGEITRLDKKYWMTLRISGQDKVLCSLGPTSNVDDLFVPGARRVLWDTQPYVVASYDLAHDRALALKEAISIPNWLPKDNENTLRAVNLQGVIYFQADKFDEAEGAFRKVLAIDSGFDVARWNLALLMVDEHDFDAAERELSRARADGYRPQQSGPLKSFQDVEAYIASERNKFQKQARREYQLR